VLVDKVEVNELTLKKQIVAEVTRYKKFEFFLLGQDFTFEVGDIDIRRCIMFLLKNGSIEEKREIVKCFKSLILLKEKQISLEPAQVM
jgi:hypothetical protein